MESRESNADRIAAGYIHLGSLDEADDYEVDEHTAMLAPDGTFLLRVASGCSCWDGEYSEETYPTLEALEAALMSDTSNEFSHPSLKGAEQLIAEVRAELAKL